MKLALFFTIVLGVSSCGSDSGSGQNIEEICNIASQIGDVILDTDDSTGSLTLNKKLNVYVIESRSATTIKNGSPIGNFYVQGSNNQLTFEPNVTVDHVCLSGADNTILVPVGSGIKIDLDTGSGNSLAEY